MATREFNKPSSQEEMRESGQQEKVNSAHKPYLSRLYSKSTPIGFQYHQVMVPEWVPPPPGAPSPRQLLEKQQQLMRLRPVFLASQTNSKELQDYLGFAQNYFQEKIPDYFSQGCTSRQRVRAQAMNFLHSLEYNYTKAKFYILFPYYLKYNSYRLHDQLSISIEDMDKKINDHLESLKNTKERDMEKWIDSLEASLKNRTSYNKIMSLLQLGKQNKYQVPEYIKDEVDKALRTGKQIRKSLQGNKLTIEALRSKKELLQEYKIVTGEMISFEDTVNRCEEWIKKYEAFEERHLIEDNFGKITIRQDEEKIQFRAIQLLVSEYNNLPLQNNRFESTVKKLYIQTIDLLDRMPTSFNRIAKTRTAKQQTIAKISYKQMREYLQQIENYPIWHEQFFNFEINMRESLEMIERMNMFLEDPLSQKNTKTLNNYLKLISDVQIENNIEKRLRMRLEYNQIMDKIKKEISNPGKVESIKEAFNKLKQKGIKQVEDSGYQEKIMLYLGWHQSQQKLKDCKPTLTNLQLIEKELQITRKLVDAGLFRSQLESAKKQLNIGEDMLEQAELRLKDQESNRQKIVELINDPNPNLENMLNALQECITCGLSFPQFETLYGQIIEYFAILVKIHYLLKIRPQNLDPEEEKQFFFTYADCEYIMSIIVYAQEVKDLKTKEGADKLLEQIQTNPFPKYLKQYETFLNFMNKGEIWANKVREMIRSFTENGESIDVKELEDSRYFIHSRAIKEEIGKIQYIMKWREKIAKKFDEEKPELFSAVEEQFLNQLQKDLIVFESAYPGTAKQQFLAYTQKHEHIIKSILSLIANQSQVDSFCKLSQMNKFHRQIQKQIERHKIDDKKILELKEKFHNQIMAADDWKERYLMVKRFEKKKIGKREENIADQSGIIDEEGQKQCLFEVHQMEVNEMSHSQQNHGENNAHITKKKYSIKNGEFTWYFKFLLMILEFNKGYKLKFCLQQLMKLKNSLTEIYRFLDHYDKACNKLEPSDVELSNLEIEGTKIQVFIREFWILKRKNAYIHSWKILADSILESVPIISMELKARKPEQLLSVLANKKMEAEEASKTIIEQKNPESYSLKRERKPNTLYMNDDITLLIDDNIGMKTKKRRKGHNGDTQYRNTAVASQAKKNAKNQLQEFERTEAILKGEIPPNFLIEDPKEYCICRYGEPNENTTMVQCESYCQQWFHIECVGIKKHQAKGDNCYTCVGCSSLYDVKSQGAFYWDFKSKISEYAFKQIVEEGKNLGVHLQQLKKINIINEKLANWKKSTNELMERIFSDDLLGKPITSYKQKLYESYLLSLWLPMFLPEMSTIKRLLMISREHSLT